MERSTPKPETDRATDQERRRDAEIDRRREAINALVAQIATLPVLDARSAEEVLGYDENGLPT